MAEPATPRPTARPRDVAADPVIVGLGVVAALSLAWMVAAPAPATVSWLVQSALDVVFVWYSFVIAARARRGAPAVRRFWRFACVGGTFMLTGDLLQLITVFGDADATAAGGIAHTVVIAMGSLCLVWALLTHPLNVLGRERLRMWLDAVIVMCAVAVFTWTVSLAPHVRPTTPTEVAVVLLGSAMMLVSAFAVVKLLLSGSAPFTLTAGLVGGIGTALVGVGTALTSAIVDSPDIRLILAARLLPCFLVAASPRIQLVQMRTDPSGLSRRGRPTYSRLPYLAAAATQALLVYQLWSEGLTVRSWGTVAGVVAITALVMIRQNVAFTDNAQLVKSLDHSMGELRRQERRFRSLVQHASDITMLLNADGVILYASPALEGVMGIAPERAVSRKAMDVLQPDDRPGLERQFRKLVHHPGGSIDIQLRARHPDGTSRWLELVATNLLDDPSVLGVIANVRDVTEARLLQDRLRYEATHDSLTGLANRPLLNERMQNLLEDPYRQTGRVAVLVLDLDDFKAVNDLLGHHVGDRLLMAVAERLRACVRPTDTVARLGGDEFAVLLSATSRSGAVSTALRMLTTLAQPVWVEEHVLTARASIGIALGSLSQGPHPPPCDPLGQSAHLDAADLQARTQFDELLRAADAAMYQAKRNESGTHLHVSEPAAEQLLIPQASVSEPGR